MKLSVIIITLNEADRLEAALSSCREIADEIVIVDSDSTDDTVEIARRHGARIFQKPFDDFSSQRNFATTCASHDWVIHLDADERIAGELRDEILRVKTRDDASTRAYSMNRLTYYIDRWIRHSGWYPDRKIRLYHRGYGRWTGTVHEYLVIDGAVKHLDGHLEHFSYRNISDHVSRTNRYASLRAVELKSRSATALYLHLLLNPPAGFFKRYFLKKGFLDGFPGMVIAGIASFGIALKYIKALEMKHVDSPRRNR